MPTTSRTQCEARPRPKAEQCDSGFPQGYELLVTTSHGVHCWSETGSSEVYKSSDNGVVACFKPDLGSKLVVAEHTRLCLQDVETGTQKQCLQLNRTQGRLRQILQGKDPQTVFFTTSADKTVLAFFLKQSRLFRPAVRSHYSPPNCVALSSTSHLLLTASTSPREIWLHNLVQLTTAIALRPTKTDANVVAVSFHPKRPNVFALAFEDGTILLFDVLRLTSPKEPRKRTQDVRRAHNGGEIGYLRSIAESRGPASRIDRVKEIVSIKFLPDAKTAIVVLGTDGRCNVVDFETPKSEGRLLSSWHVGAPATCLSVTPRSPQDSRGSCPRRKPLEDKAQAKIHTRGKGSLVAIGSINGKALLFDSTGTKLDERTFEPSGGRILSVEWVSGELSKSHARADQTKPHVTRYSNEDTGGPGDSFTEHTSLNPVKKRKTSHVPAAAQEDEETKASPLNSLAERLSFVASSQQAVPPPSSGFMSLFSPVKSKTQLEGLEPFARRRPTRRESNEPKTDGCVPRAAPSIQQCTTGDSSSKANDNATSATDSKRNRGEPTSPEDAPSANPEQKKIVHDEHDLPGQNKARQSDGLALFAPYMQKSIMKRQGHICQGDARDTRPCPKVANASTDIWLADVDEGLDDHPCQPQSRRQEGLTGPPIAAESKPQRDAPRTDCKTVAFLGDGSDSGSTVKDEASKTSYDTTTSNIGRRSTSLDESSSRSDASEPVSGSIVVKHLKPFRGLSQSPAHQQTPGHTKRPRGRADQHQQNTGNDDFSIQGKSDTGTIALEPALAEDNCTCECPHHVERPLADAANPAIRALVQEEVSKIRDELRRDMQVWQERISEDVNLRIRSGMDPG